MLKRLPVTAFALPALLTGAFAVQSSVQRVQVPHHTRSVLATEHGPTVVTREAEPSADTVPLT
ncbi:hypothetical protein [Streptomyces sp. NPDC054765]